MAKRKVIPLWAKEGDILERARASKKQEDQKYTQKFVAAMVDKDQGYWTQWRTGTTRILDEYWLVFAKELGFDPFGTRPELLEKHRLISEFISERPQTHDNRVSESATKDALDSMLKKMDAEKMRAAILDAATRWSNKDKLRAAQILLQQLEADT